MDPVRIAVIGGSGVYQIEGIADIRGVNVRTPFGDPSDTIVVGTLAGQQVAFLPRHGRGHRIAPHELPVRANIWALKSLGVERIISISACGSMKEEIAPLDIVIPDQLFDRTKSRPATFFGEGVVGHISFADPFCPEMSDVLFNAAGQAGARIHKGGTLVVMEGPQFSTRAESRIYRSWGVDIIGMTALPEAKLAREAEICYATLALVTDYDVWHEAHGEVTVEMIVANVQANAAMAKKIVALALPGIGDRTRCDCGNALKNAIITRRDLIPEGRKKALEPILRNYL